MRHFVIVCFLFLFALGGVALRSESSIRIVGGLGELTSKTVRGHGVEITQDGALTIIDASQKETLVQALCESHKNLARERNIVQLNIANAETTKTANGVPYRRQFATYDANGCFKEIAQDQSDFFWTYDPTHPDSIRDGPKEGYLPKPNINTETELQKLEQIEREQNNVRTILERLDPELIIPDQPLHQLSVKLNTDTEFTEHFELLPSEESFRQGNRDFDPYALINRPIGPNGLL